MIACEEEKQDIIGLLIEKGASVALKNKVYYYITINEDCICLDHF